MSDYIPFNYNSLPKTAPKLRLHSDAPHFGTRPYQIIQPFGLEAKQLIVIPGSHKGIFGKKADEAKGPYFLSEEEVNVLDSPVELHINSGEVVIMMTGLVHAVVPLVNCSENTHSAVKVYYELRNYKPKEGENREDGKFKVGNRSHEEKITQFGSAFSKDNTLDFGILNNSTSYYENKRKQLLELGFCVVKMFAKEQSSKIEDYCKKYLSFLMNPIKKIDLNNEQVLREMFNIGERRKEGAILEESDVKRNPKDSRSTFFPKGHGISGFGEYLPIKEDLGRIITDKLLKYIFPSEQHYLVTIGMSLQIHLQKISRRRTSGKRKRTSTNTTRNTKRRLSLNLKKLAKN